MSRQAFGIANFVGRVAAIFTPLAASTPAALLQLIFGVLALAVGLLSLALPETRRAVPPGSDPQRAAATATTSTTTPAAAATAPLLAGDSPAQPTWDAPACYAMPLGPSGAPGALEAGPASCAASDPRQPREEEGAGPHAYE